MESDDQRPPPDGGLHELEWQADLVSSERVSAEDIIASRVRLLRRLGREQPEVAAELFYSQEELAILEFKRRETGKFQSSPKLTVLQANVLMAMFAGFWGRNCDGRPGTLTLREGLKALSFLVWLEKANKAPQCKTEPPPTPT